jgi:hypothetical protein
VKGSFNAEKTHCPYGHPYAGRNLMVNCHGWRECRTCRYRRQVEWIERRYRALMDAPEWATVGGGWQVWEEAPAAVG